MRDRQYTVIETGCNGRKKSIEKINGSKAVNCFTKSRRANVKLLRDFMFVKEN